MNHQTNEGSLIVGWDRLELYDQYGNEIIILTEENILDDPGFSFRAALIVADVFTIGIAEAAKKLGKRSTPEGVLDLYPGLQIGTVIHAIEKPDETAIIQSFLPYGMIFALIEPGDSTMMAYGGVYTRHQIELHVIEEGEIVRLIKDKASLGKVWEVTPYGATVLWSQPTRTISLHGIETLCPAYEWIETMIDDALANPPTPLVKGDLVGHAKVKGSFGKVVGTTSDKAVVVEWDAPPKLKDSLHVFSREDAAELLFV